MIKSLLALGVLAAPLSAQTSVTIYNDGRVLVRREVPVTLLSRKPVGVGA